MAIFKRQSAARRTTYKSVAPVPSKAPSSPPLPVAAPAKDAALRTMLIATIPALLVGIVLAGLAFKLTGEVTARNDTQRTELDSQRTKLTERSVELDSRKTDLDARRTDLNAFANQIAQDAQQAQREANKMQAKLGTESGINERRRADIEEKRQKIETIRLTAEIVKARNNLIPNLAVNCTYTPAPIKRGKIPIDCTATNNGEHRVTYKLSLHIQDKYTKKRIDKAIKTLEGSLINTLPAKVSGGGTVFFEIEDEYKWNKDQNYELLVQFEAQTDLKVVANVRLLAKGLVDEKDLDEMAKQTYTLVINYSDVRSPELTFEKLLEKLNIDPDTP